MITNKTHTNTKNAKANDHMTPSLCNHNTFDVKQLRKAIEADTTSAP